MRQDQGRWVDIPNRPPGRYVVALGGTATFGKTVVQPFPALLDRAADCPVLNLAAPNAGPDFFLADPRRLELAAGASLAILQPCGVEGVTNPFYTVHSRRNDRFLGATPALRSLFPEVDFAEIHFTRHLLSVLQRTDPARFSHVLRGLQATWMARTQALLRHLPPRRILLRLRAPADHPPADDLIDEAMLAALVGPGATLVEVTLPEDAALPGAQDHVRIADSLAPLLRRLLSDRSPLVLRPADRVG